MQKQSQQISKVLVTGGAGFIGSYLLQQLRKDPTLQLYSIDDYSAGSEQNHINGVTYIKANTRDIQSAINFIPSLIYHLGQYSRTTASFQDPGFVWEQNCHGTFRVLQFCRKNKVRLIYGASSTKMADGGSGKDQSPYAWCKATNVDLINRYGEWFGLDYVILYFYNVYGDKKVLAKDYVTIIDLWKQNIRKNEKLNIVAPGTQLRNYTFVGDIIRGIILASQKGKGDGYSLGAQEAYTLYEVAAMLGKNKPEDLNVLPAREGDRKQSVLDLTKTINELGWKATTKLKDYLKQFLDQVRSQNDI